MKLFKINNETENKEENNYEIDLVQLEKKYNKLREEIEKHNNLYYNEDNSIISDSEYDSLIKELKNIEEKYPSVKIDFENKFSDKNITAIAFHRSAQVQATVEPCRGIW